MTLLVSSVLVRPHPPHRPPCPFTLQRQLARIAPVWHNVSVELKKDKEADKAFGWVLEM